MAMQTDVKASKPFDTAGQVKDQNDGNLGRVRIKTIYGISDAAGSDVLRDGTANTAPILITVNTPAKADAGTFWINLPGEGILAQNAVYAEITGADSAMIIYG